jgi:hypothetical protein
MFYYRQSTSKLQGYIIRAVIDVKYKATAFLLCHATPQRVNRISCHEEISESRPWIKHRIIPRSRFITTRTSTCSVLLQRILALQPTKPLLFLTDVLSIHEVSITPQQSIRVIPFTRSMHFPAVWTWARAFVRRKVESFLVQSHFSKC